MEFASQCSWPILAAWWQHSATRRWPRQLRAVALQTTLQPIAASAFVVVYLPQISVPKADTLNTSYDTYVGIVHLNGFVQPVRFYH